MSTSPSRLVAALLAAAFAMPPFAQAPKFDPFDRVKRPNEIAAQKLEADVRDALTDAQRLAASDPARAADRLRKTLAALEIDRALTPARRDLLTRQVSDRLR